MRNEMRKSADVCGGKSADSCLPDGYVAGGGKQITSGTKIFLGIGAGLLFFLVYWSWSFRAAVAKKNLEKLGELPSFTMLSAATHKNVRKEDLLGNVWVANFIFTRCAGPCPILTSNMSKLQEDLPKEVRLITFTVDPDWDKAEVLARYAKSFNADTSRWLFLTGTKKELYDLVYAGFKLSVLEEPKNQAGSRVIHSTKLVLVDKKGTIRGYYDGTEFSSVAKIKEDVSRLLKEVKGG